MDQQTSITAHYDSLLFAKVENDFMDSVNELKEKHFPNMVKLDEFSYQQLTRPKDHKLTAEEHKANANYGNKLIKEVAEELKNKTHKFAHREEMVVLLVEWGGYLGVENFEIGLNQIDSSLKSTPIYQKAVRMMGKMKAQIEPQTLQVGDKAPSFNLPDEKGETHSLADYKGKYLVIDFWASWCGPCKKEMPFMKELYNKYHKHGLEMVAVSTDRKKNEWLKAVKELDMPYLQLHDNNNEASDSYFVSGIPYVLLINPEGVIEAIDRGEELEQKIVELFKLND